MTSEPEQREPRGLGRRALFGGALAALTFTVLDKPTPAAADTTFVPTQTTQSADGTLVTLFEIQPARAGAAPFGVYEQSFALNGVWDPVLFIGYNAGPVTQGPVTAGEPTWAMGFETNYFDGSNLQCEWYIEYESADQSVQEFRPFAVSVGRNNVTDHWARVHVDIGTDTDKTKSILNFIAGPKVLSSIGHNQWVFQVVATFMGQATMAASASSAAAFNFVDDGHQKWQETLYHRDGRLHLTDTVNGRFHLRHTAGKDASTALTDLFASIKVAGNASVAQNLGVTGDSTMNGNLTVGGETYLQDLTVRNLTDIQKLAAHDVAAFDKNVAIAGSFAINGQQPPAAVPLTPTDVNGIVAVLKQYGLVADGQPPPTTTTTSTTSTTTSTSTTSTTVPPTTTTSTSTTSTSAPPDTTTTTGP